MDSGSVKGPLVDLALDLSNLTGIPAGNIYGYAIVVVDTDMEVATLSTMTDTLEAITALATGIHKLATNPAPNLVIIDQT